MKWAKRAFLLGFWILMLVSAWIAGTSLAGTSLEDVATGWQFTMIAMVAIGIVMIFPLAWLLYLAAMFGQPGSPRQWTVRRRLAIITLAVWLVVPIVTWVGSWNGPAGLREPMCLDRDSVKGFPGSSGCKQKLVAWPPLGHRITFEDAAGPQERTYPETPVWIAAIGLALLPVALWQPARRLTAGDSDPGPSHPRDAGA